MRKVRKIQAKRKACFTNKKGKKQCYILKVPKKYRANPENEDIKRIKFEIKMLIDSIYQKYPKVDEIYPNKLTELKNLLEKANHILVYDYDDHWNF